VARPEKVSRRRRLSTAEIALATIAVVLLGVIAALLVGPSGPKSDFDGFVYVESNDAQSGQNTVLAYSFRKNGLHFIGEYPTRGTGTTDPGETGALDAQGQLVVDRRRRLLFAVNQGSDTIAVFRFARHGSLIAVPGSPFPAGGKAPASVGLAGPFAVVVDKAHDANRSLDAIKPVYRTFRVEADGKLTPISVPFRVPRGSSPTQALTIGRHLVAGTEETGPFRTFVLPADGTLHQGANSPLDPEASIFAPGYDGARWAIGLAVHPTGRLLYANQAATAKLLVYTYDATGKLTFVRMVANDGSKLPCWTVVTPDGRRLFTANAGNGTVSAFDLGRDPASPHQLQTLALKHASNPWGLALDPIGKTLFVIDPHAVGSVPAGRGNRLHALAVGSDGRLTELESSPARLPVSAEASPLGIVVVPRR
jgi:6-phosphogluconolactonase (cycloisomerase 2 family)